jgi:mono/diheme cytochrome c family protein
VDASVDAAPGDGGADAAPGFDGPAGRGQYLAQVLNCGGCHTPQVNGAADNSMRLAGRDCFVSSDAGACLSSANLTNDPSGIKDLSDQAVIDGLRKGLHPVKGDGGADQYLFDRMPYYQFAALTDADAQAVVAYLRAIPSIAHTVKPPAGADFTTRPTAATFAAPDPAMIPNAAASAPATSAANGKYLGTLACITCHTVEATAVAGMPRKLDLTKAWAGGRPATAMVNGMAKMYQTANVTPDATGIMGLTVPELTAEIKTAKDKMGRMLCAPMRAFPLTDADATDIATYLLAIPPVANARTMTCQ